MVLPEQTQCIDAADRVGTLNNAAATVEKYANTGDQETAMNSRKDDCIYKDHRTDSRKSYAAELADNESDAKSGDTECQIQEVKEEQNYTMRSPEIQLQVMKSTAQIGFYC